MGRKIRTCTAEFKNEAIKLALDTSSIGEAAKDLGISVSALHAWIKQSHMSPSDLNLDGPTNENKINIKMLLDKK